MGDNGGNALPRPPRRIPAGAGSLTQMEPPGRPGGAAPLPPGRRPWIFGRILAGFIVLLVIVAGGAGAGWYVRAQTLRIDTAQVLQSIKPAVVRVLATSCAGTGEGTGVLTEGGRILTATSVIDKPLATLVVSPDGRMRRANLLGTSADGVAVLQPLGRIDDTPVPLAPGDPDPKSERALVGYTAAGKQTINPVGSAADPRALSEVMNAAKLGGPVVDKSGHLVGVVTGATVQASTIVGIDKLRGYVAAKPTGITADPGGECKESRGPQNGIVPELQVANTPMAVEVQKMLGDYLSLQNKHDFVAVQSMYSRQLAQTITPERDRQSHLTSYFFAPKITQVSLDGSSARMTFDVLFSSGASGARGRVCSKLDYQYNLLRRGGTLVIDSVSAVNPSESCETD